ncbi:MAG TPA: hypothetical protein VF331_11820 [Polyangiales bacterium]
MALIGKSAQRAQISRLGALTAFVLPLLYGVMRASPQGYLAGSLPIVESTLSSTATAWSAPAPLLARLCTLVPIGPLALRIAIASALALAAASVVLYRAIDTLLLAQGVGVAALRATVALGLCLFAMGTPSLFFQGLRPEAFALQTLLALAFLERLTELEAHWPSHDLRALYAAGLCLGGLGANDPLSALLLLTAAAPTLSRITRAKGLSPLARCGGLALGTTLCTRAGHLAAHAGFWQAVPAATHRAATLLGYPRAVLSELGVVGVLAALGAVAALQTPGVRRIGTLWASACVVPVLGYAALGLAPAAPDTLGMLSYVPAAATLLAAALCGALLAPDGVPKVLASRAQLTAVLALLALGALRLHVTATQSELADFMLPDALSGEARQRWPARSVFIASDAQTGALVLASEAEDHARPDLRVLVPSRWHGHAANPPTDAELRALVRGYLLEGELEQAELESLTAKRPVLLDPDPRLSPALFAALRCSHFAFEVLGAAASRAEANSAAEAYRVELTRLQQAASPGLSDPVAQPWLASQALTTAAFFAAAGEADSAQAAIDFGRPLAPHTASWDGLSAALSARPAGKPLDVRPFLAGDPRSAQP